MAVAEGSTDFNVMQGSPVLGWAEGNVSTGAMLIRRPGVEGVLLGAWYEIGGDGWTAEFRVKTGRDGTISVGEAVTLALDREDGSTAFYEALAQMLEENARMFVRGHQDTLRALLQSNKGAEVIA